MNQRLGDFHPRMSRELGHISSNFTLSVYGSVGRPNAWIAARPKTRRKHKEPWNHAYPGARVGPPGMAAAETARRRLNTPQQDHERCSLAWGLVIR
jgi:hypothetical protein